MIRHLALIVFAFGISTLAGQAKAASYEPKHVAGAAQICVERFEDDGLVNVVPTTITINDTQIVFGSGGTAGCVFINAGVQSISLTFQYPYMNKGQTPPTWTTPEQSFFAKEGDTISFELCQAEQDHNDPQWAASDWHNMWLLRRTGDRSAPKCAAEIETGQ